MGMKQFSDAMLPKLEAELSHQIARLEGVRTLPMHEMLTYHMGWSGGAGSQASPGKRIRPLLVLLIYKAFREDWESALPAAAAVELVHNFSLVHDDIQDNSPTRRGRPALWAKYGLPMAINAGDALFTIAHLAILDVRKSFGAELVLRSAEILQGACLDLTRGQFMDLEYQRRSGLAVEDYWAMVEGKTAALLSAGAQMGALLGSGSEETAGLFQKYAQLLGLAFQVQDDILGIWGDEALTGKSAASDLVEGKNSLPVLYALRREPRFAERWYGAPVKPEEVPGLAELLRGAGAYEFATQECKRLTVEALAALEGAGARGDSGTALKELTQELLGRAK